VGGELPRLLVDATMPPGITGGIVNPVQTFESKEIVADEYL